MIEINCKETFPGGMRLRCENPATEDGFCGAHNPARVAERLAARCMQVGAAWQRCIRPGTESGLCAVHDPNAEPASFDHRVAGAAATAFRG